MNLAFIDDAYLMPLVVVGLVVLMLFMTWVTKKYQDQQAVKRSVLIRLEEQLDKLTSSLKIVNDIPLPKELRTLFRSEIVARYQAIGVLYKHYPGLDDELNKARTLMAANDGPDISAQPPKCKDLDELTIKVKGLNDLSGLIRTCVITRLSPVDQQKLIQTISEQRARTAYRYYTAEAKLTNDSGDREQARKHIMTIMSRLQQEGPNTPLVRELYDEATGLVESYSRKSAAKESRT